MLFEEDPETPGLVYAIDEQAGTRRPFYDPTGVLRQSIMGRVDPVAPPPPAYVPEPAAPVDVAGALRPGFAKPSAPAPDAAAEEWSAAQSPTPVSVRASGAPPPPPAAPGGTVLSKAKVSPGTPGYTYDRAAEEQRGEDLLERTLEQDRRAREVDMVLNEQQLELQKQKEEAARREQINAERSSRYEKELDGVVRTEINQDRIQQNSGFFGSLLGMIGQTVGYLAKPGSGLFRLQQDLDRRVQRDIDAQREQKDSMINMLTKKLGSAQQAENHYRAQVNAFTADLLENRLGRLGLANQYADKIQGLRDQAMAYNEAAKAASFGKPGTAEYTFERPKPTGTGGPTYTNQTLSALKGMGIDEKRYREGLDAKLASGITVAQGADNVKQLDRDVNTLNSLMEANGGELRGKEVINIPQVLIPTLSQMGIEAGMQREQVNQLLQAHLEQRAKQIFGSQVPSGGWATIQKEIGDSPQAYFRWLQRMRDTQNNGVRTQLEKEFPGRGQQVFDLMLGGSSKNVGVPQVKPTPFEKRNPKEQPAETRELSDVEKKQRENRARVSERVRSFFSEDQEIKPPSRAWRSPL